jgi:excinuclease UvrABC ATPase subunit
VATVTEIYDYLRLLYARVGKVFCYSCGKPIVSRSATQIVDEVMELGTASAAAKISVLSPIVRARKGEYRKELKELLKEGFARVRIDGQPPARGAGRCKDCARPRQAEEARASTWWWTASSSSRRARQRVADSIELAHQEGRGPRAASSTTPGRHRGAAL